MRKNCTAEEGRRLDAWILECHSREGGKEGEGGKEVERKEVERSVLWLRIRDL